MSREQARERFRRIGALRANRVIEDLRILTNCADLKNYQYTEDQVSKIFGAIEAAVAASKSKFIPRAVSAQRIEL